MAAAIPLGAQIGHVLRIILDNLGRVLGVILSEAKNIAVRNRTLHESQMLRRLGMAMGKCRLHI